MRVVCIGTGYVGTTTGAAFALLGHDTTLVDVDPEKVARINEGRSSIYEPGLDDVIVQCKGRLDASLSYQVVQEADVVVIAVGTPEAADGSADLRYVEAATKMLAAHLARQSFQVVVMKSTVPPGTCDRVISWIEEESGLVHGRDFAVVSNPEFLREGFALEDVLFPDRIIVGSSLARAQEVMKELYHNILERVNYRQLLADFDFLTPAFAKSLPVYFMTDPRSSELIKYASNAFLAIKISYINEMARLCDSLGANVLDVAIGMGQDVRIGNRFLEVSSGWSGSCFPKDTSELLTLSRLLGSELTLVKTAIDSNREMHEFCVRKVEHHLQSLQGKTIGILGLTFKPNTDDTRRSQALYLIERFQKLGANIRVHDPIGMDNFWMHHGIEDITYCSRAEEVAQSADAVVLLTHWQEYLHLDWAEMHEHMREAYVLDTRNFLPMEHLQALGFRYEGLGTGRGVSRALVRA